MKKYIDNINREGQGAPAKILRSVGFGKCVLEVGCASGLQSRILKENQGCTITGIEIDADAAMEARKYCESVIVGDLEVVDLSGILGQRRYDVIIVADVLEHLRSPAGVLEKLKRYLNDKGTILASIPNVVYAGLILAMANGRFDYRRYGLLDDTHLRFFALKSIYALFESCGLKIDNIDRVLCQIESSEFHLHPLSPPEAAMLEHVKCANPEWQTYQFIVTATLQRDRLVASSYAELKNADILRDLEQSNQALSSRIRVLEGQISWMESRPLHKLLSRLKLPLRWISRNLPSSSN